MIAMVLVGWALAMLGLSQFLIWRYLRILDERYNRFFGIMTKEYGSKIASNGEKVDHLFVDLDRRIRYLHTLIDRAGKVHVDQEMDDK